jgi:hypothetical protein
MGTRKDENKEGSDMDDDTLTNEKIRAEIAKLMAETSKINSENKWYPAIIASSATLAIVAIVKLFL